ncbi:MAG: hypothetical protein IPH78_07355 [Bacteroidetes bacterium]|nr:hypothetical protein [Bacteroidota bacterium]MBK8657862.1 hypothetical protein [Bacteroidota bacterium]
MTKILSGILLGVVLTTLIAFKAATYEAKNNTAEVDQIQGVYIYAKSKPIRDYEFLGTVNAPKVAEHEFDILVDLMLKDLKKKYPTADGLLFDGPIKQSHNTKASAIKLKP